MFNYIFYSNNFIIKYYLKYRLLHILLHVMYYYVILINVENHSKNTPLNHSYIRNIKQKRKCCNKKYDTTEIQEKYISSKINHTIDRNHLGKKIYCLNLAITIISLK